jgi:hypothetical protein
VADGLVTIASGLTAPSQIAVDCQSVYWDATYVGTLVMKASIGGGTAVTLASGQVGQNGLAIDSTFVYWAADGMLLKVPIVGGAVTTLVPVTATDGGGSLVPQQVATRSGYTYFSDQDTTNQMDLRGLVLRVPSSGGSASILVPEDEGFGGAFAVDDAFVYWVGDGGAMKTPVNGGAAVTLGAIPYGKLAVDSEFLYWVSGSVGMIPINGGASITLAADITAPQDQAAGEGIALDSNFLYWSSEFAGTVEKVSLSGGAVTTLASGQDFPMGLAVDDHSVYWANEDNGGMAGTIMQLTPK